MRMYIHRLAVRSVVGALCGAALAFPAAIQAQDSSAISKPSGKWTGTVAQLQALRGAADLSVTAKGEKESRIKFSLRLVPINRQVAWDVVAGRCGDEGRPIAAAAAFRQVLTRNDGSGEGMATVPALQSGKPYYFRVFSPGEVPSDRSGYGCANLSEVP